MPQKAYLKLYSQLKRQIQSGAYPYASRFPSKRTIAEETGLSLTTVQHAFEILCDEGWLTARERSGFFVDYQEKIPASPPSVPEPSEPFPIPDGAVQGLSFSIYARILRSVLNLHGERIMEKSPNSGCPELREALAGYLAAHRGMAVSPAQIMIGSGAEYLYSMIVRILGRDQIYALESPSYDAIRRVYESEGVRYRMLPMAPDGIRSDALWKTDAQILHVTPFHSWPTGITVHATKRREYLSWASSRGGFLVEDDFDSELSASSKAEDTLFSLNPDLVIHLNTFTRTVSPALRVGYMVLPVHLLPLFQDRAGFFSCSVPVTEQLTLAELIRSGEFVRHLNRVRRSRRREKESR